MRRGAHHIPLYNPPQGLPQPPRYCNGYPVEFDARLTNLPAKASGYWPAKRIVVGPQWLALPANEQNAVLLHEAGHCAHFHAEIRLLLTPFFWSRFVRSITRAQEFEADRHAASYGRAMREALIQFLLRRPQGDDPFGFVPRPALRIAALRALPEK